MILFVQISAQQIRKVTYCGFQQSGEWIQERWMCANIASLKCFRLQISTKMNNDSTSKAMITRPYATQITIHILILHVILSQKEKSGFLFWAKGTCAIIVKPKEAVQRYLEVSIFMFIEFAKLDEFNLNSQVHNSRDNGSHLYTCSKMNHRKKVPMSINNKIFTCNSSFALNVQSYYIWNLDLLFKH